MSEVDEVDEAIEGVDLLPSPEVLEHAREITAEYIAEGVTLGVRALYYQFVGRGIVSPEELAISDKNGNNVGAHRFYKRLGRICSEARYNGHLDIDALADEGREVFKGDFTRNDVDVDAAHEAAGDWIRSLNEMLMRTDRWVRQPYFVSVWVEKQGLGPVVKPVCDELGASFLACKGYPSVSALWEWVQHADFVVNGERPDDRRYTYGPGLDLTERHVGGFAHEAVVLYFGDHDPDGFEIPRSSERGIRRLMKTYDREFPLTFKRCALSLAQARKFNLPPFEAKMSSARYKGYRAEHGTDEAWEIDALDMRVLRDMVRSEVSALFSPTIGLQVEREAERRSEDLRQRIKDPAWIASVFDEEG